MQDTDIVERLTKLAASRGLTETALESCRRALEAARRESQEVGEVFCEGRDLQDLTLTWQRHALVFNHRLLSYALIESTVLISVVDPDGVHFENRRPIGAYRLMTTLETGQPEDDYLEWLPASDAATEYER